MVRPFYLVVFIAAYGIYFKLLFHPLFTEYGLVAFSDRRQFWVIAPDRSLLLQCSSVEFYCQQTYLVPLTALFFNLFVMEGAACGTIFLNAFLGIECTPGLRM